MVTIGSFTADKDSYTGTIRTLTVNVKAKIVANDRKKSEGAPTSGSMPGGPSLARPGKRRPMARSRATISASSSTIRAFPSRSARRCSRMTARRFWCGTGATVERLSKYLIAILTRIKRVLKNLCDSARP